MKNLNTSIYLVTDTKLTRRRPIEEIVERACAAGVTLVQFRDKESGDDIFIEQAKKLRRITAQYGVQLLLNDRVDLVDVTGADGVHIGQSDLSLEETRKKLGEGRVIGVSFITPKQAAEAERRGANYIALSPVFSTATKADIDTPAGIEGIQQAAALVKIPIVGIGGINAENASDVIAAGAAGIAVVTAITMAEDIEAAVISLKNSVEEGFQKRRSNH